MAVADDKLKAAIDETIAPLVADHGKYLAVGGSDAVPVSRAELHYVYDQYGTELLDFSNSLQPVGHRHTFVDAAIREHLDHYLNVGPHGQQVLRWPTEYAHDLVHTFDEPDGLQVLFTEGEHEARRVATQIAEWKAEFGTRTFHFAYRDGGLADQATIRDEVDRERQTGRIVIIDESRTGFGRLGSMWGQQAYGVKADLTVLGGPVGGGMALGAVIGHRDLFTPFTPYISPQAGNPVACAAGAATLKAINPGVIEHVKEAGAHMHDALFELTVDFENYVPYTHGRGLLRTLEFNAVGHADQFVVDCRRRGLLLTTPSAQTSSVILTPTLIASVQEIERGVGIMGEVLLEWAEKDGLYTS